MKNLIDSKFFRAAVLFIVFILLFSLLTSCGNSSNENSDFDYVKKKKSMVVGITLFEPMNYFDEDGNLTGFETEFATNVALKLGIDVVFKEIDWDKKTEKLNNKSIDCVWNGLTLSENIKNNMEVSVPYMNNRQVLIGKEETLKLYAESLKDAEILVENGSSGESLAGIDERFSGANIISVSSQAEVLADVNSGSFKLGIVDYVMAANMIKEGSEFEVLKISDRYIFDEETYIIGFRKGSDLCDKVNNAILELKQEGRLSEIAEKYNIQDLLILN